MAFPIAPATSAVLISEVLPIPASTHLGSRIRLGRSCRRCSTGLGRLKAPLPLLMLPALLPALRMLPVLPALLPGRPPAAMPVLRIGLGLGGHNWRHNWRRRSRALLELLVDLGRQNLGLSYHHLSGQLLLSPQRPAPRRLRLRIFSIVCLRRLFLQVCVIVLLLCIKTTGRCNYS